MKTLVITHPRFRDTIEGLNDTDTLYVLRDDEKTAANLRAMGKTVHYIPMPASFDGVRSAVCCVDRLVAVTCGSRVALADYAAQYARKIRKDVISYDP
jgi:hypothetical protein